jgi:hypothetical protein
MLTVFKNGMWAIMCVIAWHDCTWHGQGYATPPPSPNWVMPIGRDGQVTFKKQLLLF